MLTIGIPYDVAFRLNPNKMKPFEQAFEDRKKMIDSQMWMMGYYVYDAVLVAIEQNLAGKKAKNKYFDKPLMQQVAEKNGTELSEEEKMEQVKLVFQSLEIKQANFELNKANKGRG